MKKPPLKPVPSLSAAIINYCTAFRSVHIAWDCSQFRKMLIAQATCSPKPVLRSDDPEEYPRLRCYRGTGYVVRLLKGSVKVANPEMAELVLEADWVGCDVDPVSESSGCPGAPVKKVRHTLYVPFALLNNLTPRGFNAWAAKQYAEQVEFNRRQLEANILAIAKSNHINLAELAKKAR